MMRSTRCHAADSDRRRVGAGVGRVRVRVAVDSAISDSVDWIVRLRRAFGSPNFTCSMELCGWGRYLASMYTFGAPVPGAFMPDLERAGCILYWGYNPSVARLVHATATVDARRRGAKLVTIDPRRAESTMPGRTRCRSPRARDRPSRLLHSWRGGSRAVCRRTIGAARFGPATSRVPGDAPQRLVSWCVRRPYHVERQSRACSRLEVTSCGRQKRPANRRFLMGAAGFEPATSRV